MLKFAVVGCGRIAIRHCDLLAGGMIKGAGLSAVCDIIDDKAEKFGEKYKVPYFTDMNRMMEKEDVDIVSVLTPSGMHAEHVVNLAQYKKHIVVEKPMALTLEDADRMINSCSSMRIKLFVIKQNRYNYPVQKLREAILQKRFGRIVLGTVRVRWRRDQNYYDQDAWRGTWSMDGGVFANQASHHIDLLEWMLGEPESVFAKAATALVDIETEDTGLAIIRFKSGALGLIEATTAARPKDLEGSISILGEMGAVEIGGFAMNEMKTWNFTEPLSGDEAAIKEYSQNPPNVYGFGHLAYLNHVVSAIVDNKEVPVDGEAGRKSIELIIAIYKSIETGKEIFLKKQPLRCRLGEKKG